MVNNAKTLFSLSDDFYCWYLPGAISQDELLIPPKGLLLVTHEPNFVSTQPGPHIRGNTLRAFSVGEQEVDLLLPGTARYFTCFGDFYLIVYYILMLWNLVKYYVLYFFVVGTWTFSFWNIYRPNAITAIYRIVVHFNLK